MDYLRNEHERQKHFVTLRSAERRSGLGGLRPGPGGARPGHSLRPIKIRPPYPDRSLPKESDRVHFSLTVSLRTSIMLTIYALILGDYLAPELT